MGLTKRLRWAVWLALLGAGTLLQVGNNGCASYYVTAAVSAFDFCSVFNCTGGSFFNLCQPNAIFVDCP